MLTDPPVQARKGAPIYTKTRDSATISATYSPVSDDADMICPEGNDTSYVKKKWHIRTCHEGFSINCYIRLRTIPYFIYIFTTSCKGGDKKEREYLVHIQEKDKAGKENTQSRPRDNVCLVYLLTCKCDFQETRALMSSSRSGPEKTVLCHQ